MHSASRAHSLPSNGRIGNDWEVPQGKAKAKGHGISEVHMKLHCSRLHTKQTISSEEESCHTYGCKILLQFLLYKGACI